jgi:UDP-glucose 4-epimerase
MIALVTGGYGFIGNQIVESISKEFEEVRVLDSLVNTAREVKLPNVSLIKGDVRDINTVTCAFKDVDVVFHTAAQIDVVTSINEPFFDLDNNIKGTLTVCEGARRCDTSKLIYSSSAAVYGNCDVFPITEEQPIRPLSPYSISKYCGELYISYYHSTYGLKTPTLRYFNVYGPYQRPENAYSGVINKFIYRASKRLPIEIYGDGRQTRDFVYVTDVAKANLFAAKSKVENTAINIGSGKETSINKLAMMVKKMTSSSSSIVNLPPRAADGRRSLADIRKAKKLIGYEPQVNIYEGLKALCKIQLETLI